jgi:hypothetical protein
MAIANAVLNATIAVKVKITIIDIVFMVRLSFSPIFQAIQAKHMRFILFIYVREV